MRRLGRAGLALLAAALLIGAARSPGQPPDRPPKRPIVLIDTDAGDDIDDAFALAWALRSPALDVRLVTTSFGDTGLRARMVRRMAAALGRPDLPVAAGPSTPSATVFTQAAWARGGPDGAGTDGVAAALDLIRANPGRVTLIALAPLTTIGAMIARDPATFAKLRAALVMGGSIARGYDKVGRPSAVPDAEWNVAQAPAGMRALLASGVPVTLFPLDATQIRPDPAMLARLTAPAHPATAMLGTLVAEWRAANPWRQTVPTLFDAVPVAAAIDPALCPVMPMRIAIDDEGFTRRIAGPPNARVCLASDGPAILGRLAQTLDPD